MSLYNYLLMIKFIAPIIHIAHCVILIHKITQQHFALKLCIQHLVFI